MAKVLRPMLEDARQSAGRDVPGVCIQFPPEIPPDTSRVKLSGLPSAGSRLSSKQHFPQVVFLSVTVNHSHMNALCSPTGKCESMKNFLAYDCRVGLMDERGSLLVLFPSMTAFCQESRGVISFSPDHSPAPKRQRFKDFAVNQKGLDSIPVSMAASLPERPIWGATNVFNKLPNIGGLSGDERILETLSSRGRDFSPRGL